MQYKITQSSIKKFLSCRRKYKYRYVEELVRKGVPSLNLTFGTFIHEYLERWFNGEDEATLLADVRETEDFALYEKKEAEAKVKALAMLSKYFETYPRKDDPFNVVGTEIEFATPLYNPDTDTESPSIMFGGKIDGLVERNGEYWILEHKTAGYVSESYIQKVWFDAQIQLYAYYFGRAKGIKVVGALYDVLGKSQLKWCKADTEVSLMAKVLAQYDKKQMFLREFIPIEEEIMHHRLQETWIMGHDMFKVATEDAAAYRNTNNCFEWKRPCEYLSLCQARNRDAVSYLYDKRVAHEELGNATETKDA